MIRISDIKQYIYCPRIIYYQYCLMVDKKPTYKMEHGTAIHEIEEALEGRRKLKAFWLKEGKKEFEKSVYGKTLTGKIDLLITVETETSKKYYPVDYKYTTGNVHPNHIYQITGYALLLEEAYGTVVDTGFVYLIPRKYVEVIEITDEKKDKCREYIANINAIMDSDVLPDATEHRAKCVDCEYNRFCDDIW